MSTPYDYESVDLLCDLGISILKVASTDAQSGKLALEKIENITAEPELNEIYTGTVVKTMDFGAFVNFMGAKDGLVHISELSEKRVGIT